MKLTRTIIPYILLFLITLISGVLLRSEYRDVREECSGVLASSFASAIHHEKENRLKNNKMSFSYGSELWPQSDTTTIITGSGEVIAGKRDTLADRLSLSEKLQHVQQTYLYLEGKPINVYVLDSIFRNILTENKIPVQTAVTYTDNPSGTTCSSRDDTAFYIQALYTAPVPLGVQKEITVQGYGLITPSIVICKKPKLFIVTALIWLAATCVLIFYATRRKKKSPVSGTDGEMVAPPAAGGAEMHVSWNAKTRSVCYGQKEIRLTEQQTVLFNYLWNSPEHFATYDELIGCLCGKDDIEKGENRLSQAVARLRKKLENVPDLTIENVTNRGYQLQIMGD